MAFAIASEGGADVGANEDGDVVTAVVDVGCGTGDDDADDAPTTSLTFCAATAA